MRGPNELPAFQLSITGWRLYSTVNAGSARPSGEKIKATVLKHNDFGFVEFQDGHVEVRWPESPDQWSYYVSMDAAMIAAELRGYSRG